MNTLGNQFKVSSFGESHGAYVGSVIEGCPAGLRLNMKKIQEAVDKRKTNQTVFSSTRNESDQVQIISGVFEGITLGSPICILIKNEDARSSDYDELKNIFRPGHADFSYQTKYGIRDYRGGGRSSIRLTASMVAAGEIASQLLHHFFDYENLTYVSQIGNISMSEKTDIQKKWIDASVVKCPNEETTQKMLQIIEEAKQQGDTLGGAISCVLKNIPAGLGEPIFGKLQAQLAHAMMNINTAKAFEYGEGKASATMKGSQHNDLFFATEKQVKTQTNHHGGILGGISTGMDIYFSVYFKPISSIQQTQQTINQDLEETKIHIRGRHDVCAVPRAISIVEAYTHIVFADLFLQNQKSKLNS